MDFVAVLDQVITLLRQRGRLTYRTLERQFELDDAALEDLKEELMYGQRLAVDEDERVLVWMGDTAVPTPPASGRVTAVNTSQVRAPLTYTPPYLAEKILTSRSALEGERKQVTVLFADLKGSMELLADRDPEEARQLLDPVLERMMAAVHRYEGTVNQVMGDGIMALFGAPLAREDHAVRACYAALAMQAAVQQYAVEVQRTHGVPLQMRVGLNAGEVVVRTIGNDLHMDYSAIGQTTHLAARMEQMAMPGSILITPAVLGLAEGYVQVRALGPMPVRGLDVPVEVFELVGASGIRRRLQAAAVRGLTRFVGRDTELAALGQALERAGAGQGQVVAVVGEAGVGKSRLVYECVRSPRTQGWLVLESASVSYGKATPYFPVIDLLKRYVHVEDADEPRTVRARVTGQVLTLDETLQALAEAPEESLQRSLAQLQTTEFLYETRLFPEREYTFKHALTHEVAYGSLLLERRRVLHARIVPALEALAGDRVAEQVERLVHHALRGEVWDKALAYCRQAGEKTMARSAHREAVGYFEQALNAVQHLPEQCDTFAQAIDLRLALRSALQPSGDLGRILALLREAEALAEALDDPRRLGQVSIFLSLYFRNRGAYDQAITSALRALALATTKGDGVLHALANRVLGLAYQPQGDYRRAINCFMQTVASLDGVQRHERFGQVFLPAVTSCAYLAVCHAEMGTFAEGRAFGEEGLQIAEAVAHPGSLMLASWGMGLLALRQGDLPRALPLLERAVDLCQDADIPSRFSEMAAALGVAYTLGGRIADAMPLLTQALEQTTTIETVFIQALCRLSLAEAQARAGCLAEAQTIAGQALALARTHQERDSQAYTLRLLGEIAARREPPQVELAAAHYQHALTLAAELGMRPLQAHCHRGLGTLYIATGQREQARAALSTAMALYRDMDMTFWLPQAEAALAQVG